MNAHGVVAGLTLLAKAIKTKSWYDNLLGEGNTILEYDLH